jgi:hypothetical protein
MIKQIAPIPTKTKLLPKIKKGLIQGRPAQSPVEKLPGQSPLPEVVEVWSPITSGPYIVPVTRWIE